jgi:NADH:ubiquinone oxidoreductase subunit 6 (subunit J)
MTIQQPLFFLFAITVLASAIMVVTSRNLFHSALFLILSFFGVAGFYVLLEAGFFAVAQVLVYIGAISILIIFAVMLTRGMQSMIPRNSQAVVALIVAAASFVILAFTLQPYFAINVDLPCLCIPSLGIAIDPSPRQVGQIPWQYAGEAASLSAVPQTYIADFGRALTDINQYAVPFELASVLIVLAMIGAIWVARERKPAEIIAERAEIAAEEAAEMTLPRQEKLPLPEVAPAHVDAH